MNVSKIQTAALHLARALDHFVKSLDETPAKKAVAGKIALSTGALIRSAPGGPGRGRAASRRGSAAARTG